MFVELSGNASIQLGIQRWSVIPCGVGLLKIISILELAVAHVLLIESGHVERLERRGRECQEKNVTKRGSTGSIKLRTIWIINEPNSIPLIGSCHQKVNGYCCRPMFDIPIPRAPDPKRLSRGVGVLGAALIRTRAFVQMLDRAWSYQSLMAVNKSKSQRSYSYKMTCSPSHFNRKSKSRIRGSSDELSGEKSGTSGGTKDEAGCTGDRHNGC
jgi:hypothetical protein